MTIDVEILSQELQERILEKLGFSHKPETSLDGLKTIYSAWCNNVPFDNVRKLIHVNAENKDVLPGDTPVDFFESWLLMGAGGTCWAGNGALHSLLTSLGFSVSRGVCTMIVAPDLPPNHGTVLAKFDSETYLVDASILHINPIKLRSGVDTNSGLPSWVKRVHELDEKWHVLWCALHRPDYFYCRLDYQNADSNDFHKRHENTRVWSPFNYELTIRKVKGNSVSGIAVGKKVELSQDSERAEYELTPEQKKAVLIEEFGLAEEIVEKIPEDRPTPPPPASRTAQQLSASE